MKGLNLSSFKKLKSDSKSTTLKHPDGHTITLAHKALSPANQKELHALPFADGGEIPGGNGSPSIDPSKVGGDVTTSGDPLVKAISDTYQKIFGESKAKGGMIDDPTQRNLTSGDKQPNRIEQQVVSKARSRFEDGGYVDITDSDDPLVKAVSPKKPESTEHQGEGYTSTPLRHLSPPNAKDEAYKKSVADYNAKMAPQSKAHGGEIQKQQGAEKQITKERENKTIDWCRCDNTVGDNPKCKQHAKKTQMYAEGGETQEMDPDSMQAQQSPMQQQPQQDAAPLAEMPAGQAPMSAASQQATPQAQEPPMSPMRKDLEEQDLAWQHDLYNQHVKPETYKSLFAKKDTLGKIGTAFGLLIGGGTGAGGGGNSVLNIMKQQIDNDMDAQKTSKANAQNFIRLNQSNLMNNAQISQLFQQGKLTQAQAQEATADAHIKAEALGRIQTNWSAFHDLTEKVKSLPAGSPQQAAGQQQLAMLAGQINNENLNIKDRAEVASALSKSFSNTGAGADAEQAFQAQNRSLRLAGQDKFADDREAKHIPGIPGQASAPVNEGDRKTIQAMNILDNKGKDVLDFVRQHKGTWDPRTRAVAEQKIEEMKNFYNDSIKGGSLTQGRLGWYDEQFAKHPTDILSQIMGSSAKLQEMVSSNANRRDQLLSGPGGLGFPKQSAATPKSTTSKSNSGREMIQRNGKWYYK